MGNRAVITDTKELNSYNLREMLISIDKRQPEKDRIGEEGIDQYLKEGNKNG